MPDSLVHVRFGKQLKKEMNEVVKAGWFSNQAELIREGARKIILEYYRRKALENLPKQLGALKGKGKGLTDADRERIAREHTPERALEITRRFGFNEDD
ncbi:MAG: ribbon-helix-helix domain-containing protein [Candidatus Diapherotrites archaeon]